MDFFSKPGKRVIASTEMESYPNLVKMVADEFNPQGKIIFAGSMLIMA